MEELGSAIAAFMLIFVLIVGGFTVLMIASMWKVFTKAGRPGWAAIVPVYNAMLLAEIGGKPNWWGIMTIIPLVGIVFYIMICMEVGKAFGKGAGFGVCLFFFAPICWPILGFGKAQYIGAGAQAGYAQQPMAAGYPQQPQAGYPQQPQAGYPQQQDNPPPPPPA